MILTECVLSAEVVSAQIVSCKECKKWDHKTFASFLEYMRSFQDSTEVTVVNSPHVPATQDGAPAHVAAAEMVVPPPSPPRGQCLQ